MSRCVSAPATISLYRARRREEFSVFRHDPTDPASIGNDALFALEVDRTGMMWVGSKAQSGVDKFDPSAAGFANYKHRAGYPESLSSSSVWRVYVPPSRPYDIWSVHQADAQRSHDRLGRIDRLTGRVEHYVHDPSDPNSIGRGQIPAILEDGSGRLWIATSTISRRCAQIWLTSSLRSFGSGGWWTKRLTRSLRICG